MTFPPLGGLSPTLAFCFVVFHLVCRLPLGTYWKPTGLFPYILCSGQLLSLILAKTVLLLTPCCALDGHLWLGHMVKSAKQGQTSCMHMELGLSQNGSMTICLLTYLIIILGNTTSGVSDGPRILLTGVSTNTEVTFGLVVTSSMMALLRNLTRTVVLSVPIWVFLTLH